MIGIDNVVDIPCCVIPEATAEASETLREPIRPLRCRRTRAEYGADAKGVQPERLHFHRLANAGRHYPIADFRVHPGQLNTRNARHEQTVLVAADAVSRSHRIS